MKFIKSLACAAFATLLISCNSDVPVSESKEIALLETKALEQNFLSFSSIEEYNLTLDSLHYLSHPELLKWLDKKDNFVSMYSAHDKALNEILEVATEDEYFNLKRKYESLFIFNDSDYYDLSVYLPVVKPHKAAVLNPNGFVKIGNELVNMKECSDYSGLQEIRQLESPSTRDFIRNGINVIESEAGKRWFRAQIGSRFGQQAIRVNAKKRVLFGWSEYTTAYFWRLSENGPLISVGEYRSGSDILIPFPYPNGTKLYMWSRGVDEPNRAVMTVQL